jgi:3-hydroxyacyl-[acyl-carrier-protein] dehydratase
MRLEYFQMIDRVTAYDAAARTIACQSQVPDASPVFEGHFPGHPLVPGVLLVETMAQASGQLALALNNFDRMPFLAGVKEAKFRSFVMPSRPLDIEASLVHDGSGFVITRARITSEGGRVCDAEIVLRLMPFPNTELRGLMLEQANRIGLRCEATAR